MAMTALLGQSKCGGKATDALKMSRLPLKDGHLVLQVDTASGNSVDG